MWHEGEKHSYCFRYVLSVEGTSVDVVLADYEGVVREYVVGANDPVPTDKCSRNRLRKCKTHNLSPFPYDTNECDVAWALRFKRTERLGLSVIPAWPIDCLFDKSGLCAAHGTLISQHDSITTSKTMTREEARRRFPNVKLP